MKILLVTFTSFLEQLVAQILNPANNYRAIVVDEVEPARKILSKFGYPAENVFPFHELPECVKNFYYDYVVCASGIGEAAGGADLTEEVQRCGVPRNKFVNLASLNTAEHFLLDRALRYYQKNFKQFKMFATGISYAELGLMPKVFTKKLFNFGYPSQDLYFDFQVAKKIISTGGGGWDIITHALICLAPYSFHYDESQAMQQGAYLITYPITLNDTHNFWLPAEKYRSLFRAEYLNFHLPIDNIELDAVRPLGAYSVQNLDSKKRLLSRKRIDAWNDKNYPGTVQENKKILDDYLTLCEDNNIVPIMFLPPPTEGYKKYFCKQKLEEFFTLVGEAMSKHKSAKFFNGWLLQGITDADFLDVDHLNINGAEKFSRALNDFIEQL